MAVRNGEEVVGSVVMVKKVMEGIVKGERQVQKQVTSEVT